MKEGSNIIMLCILFTVEAGNKTQEGEYDKLDWVKIYFANLLNSKSQCNLCQFEIESNESDKYEKLNHIQDKHKEIYDLHKANPDENVGFQIEFLQFNVLHDEGKTLEVAEVTTDEQRKEVTQDKNVQLIMVQKEGKKTKAKSGSKVDSRKRSWVWKYFDKLSNVIYRCTVCNVVLSIKGSNTNNMNRHVKSKHPDIHKAELMSLTSGQYVKSKEILGSPCLGSQSDVECEVVIDNTMKDDEVVAGSPKKSTQSKLTRRSFIWRYFTRVSETIAQCKLCHRKINHGGSATGNMNRHLKFLHKDLYAKCTVNMEDTNWIWQLFSEEASFYSCKICEFKCLKLANAERRAAVVLEHLRLAHGVLSADQIIISTECDAKVDECTVAVDFLKDSEEF